MLSMNAAEIVQVFDSCFVRSPATHLVGGGTEPLDFVRVAVLQRDEKTTTIDLNDDLSARAPS